MVGQEINKRTFYYQLYEGMSSLKSGEYRTGERVPVYSSPIMMKANISPANGQSNIEQFGNLDDYSKVILLYDMDCPIDEQSVLWIDVEPQYDGEGKIINKHDYIVKHVAKSLNVISYAIAKVDVR